MKVVMSGGEGKLATEILEHNTEHEIIAPSRLEMDVCRPEQLDEFNRSYKPDVFIHTAALTRPMIKHIERPQDSIWSNIIGTSNVVVSCMSFGVKLVYISTDYVYPGIDGNYSEDDPVLPVNEYAWSKLGGECAVRLYPNSLILRASIVENPFPHEKALVNCYKSAIYIDEAANLILKLLNETGVINVGGKGQSVYEFVKETNSDIGELSLKDVSDVGMPVNSIMNINKLREILDD